MTVRGLSVSVAGASRLTAFGLGAGLGSVNGPVLPATGGLRSAGRADRRPSARLKPCAVADDRVR